jgi:hypothetical protein
MAKAIKTSSLYAKWAREIDSYENDAEKWETRSRKIIDRYLDKSTTSGDNKRLKYNILWANVQVLIPAMYAKDPIPRIERRFKQKDMPARIGAEMIQNCLSYLIECTNYGEVIRAAVLDRLLPGRGTAWVRYEAKTEAVQITDDAKIGDDTDNGDMGDEQPNDNTSQLAEPLEPEERLVYEKAIPDYVHWEDFGHSWARTWEEVPAVWRKTYMNKAKLKERFPDIYKDIPLNHCQAEKEGSKSNQPEGKEGNEAVIYEIWDKDSKKAIWFCKDYKEDVLDVLDDPLEIEGFFPCPRPIYATLANHDLIPTPDYAQYQYQAQELDELTIRIALIVKAIKVAGVYDGSAPAIRGLLSEGAENKLVAVDTWAMFAEKGGLKGSMEFLPLQEIASTYIALQQARESLKKDIQELTGLSDIVRGSTFASETATAQEIKAKYSNLRLSQSQRDVERFCRDLLRIMGDLVASKFSPETLMKMSGIQLMSQEQKQQLQMAIQAGQQTGQPPQIPPEVQEAMQKPSIEEVLAVLRNDDVRGFRIEVETDSTIQSDEEADKKAAVEAVQAIGGYFKGIAPIVQAGALSKDAATSLLLTLIRKFRFGSEVEEAFEESAKQPPTPPQPDPQQAIEQGKMQAQGQLEQQKLQMQGIIEKGKMEAQQSIEQLKIQSEQQIEQMKLNSSAQLAIEIEGIKAQTAIQVAQINAGAQAQPELLAELQAIVDKAATDVAPAAAVHEHLSNLIQTLQAPKQMVIQRDPATGRPVGMVSAPVGAQDAVQ